MSDERPHDPAEGGVTTEVRDRILLIGLDRPAKMNGYTPQMARQLVDAFERLDEDDDLWCGVLFGHGDHFTAGLDLPKFRDAMKGGQRYKRTERVDPMGLGRRCRKPLVTAVQGVTFTLGIELMLAGDIVVAADDCRFSQLEPLRGIHAAGRSRPIRRIRSRTSVVTPPSAGSWVRSSDMGPPSGRSGHSAGPTPEKANQAAERTASRSSKRSLMGRPKA